MERGNGRGRGEWKGETGGGRYKGEGGWKGERGGVERGR